MFIVIVHKIREIASEDTLVFGPFATWKEANDWLETKNFMDNESTLSQEIHQVQNANHSC